MERIRAGLKKFSAKDQLWDEKLLLSVALKTFNQYSDAYETFTDWEETQQRFNQSAVKHLFHPNVSNEVKAGNRNKFSIASVLAQSKCDVSIGIIHARNSSNDNNDCFTACIDVVGFRLVDWFAYLAPGRYHRSIYASNLDAGFYHQKEFWTFQRDGNKWLLLCIHDQHNWETFTNMRILDDKKNVA